MKINKPGKAKSGLFRIVFSRTGFILLLILLQLGLFVVTTNILQGYAFFIHGGLTVLGVVVLIYIINSEDNPAFKMTWMLCVMAFPAVATMFYIYVKTQAGTRWMGKRPRVRGVVMNPVDHPMGGGEGRTSGGGHPVSPWGQLAKGYPTRVKSKPSNSMILIRRNGKKFKK